MARTRQPRLKARVALERDGRILCVLHAKPDRDPFWCLPGGNVDPGETLTEAAVRELREEVGAEVAVVEVILRGTLVAGEPALGDDSGDPYLADLAWHPRTDLPDAFRPAALRDLLAQGPLAGAPVADWAP